MLSRTLVSTALSLTTAFSLASPAAAQHVCEQDHPGGTDRLHRSVKDGDVKVCRGIAGHTVRNAVSYYEIDRLVSSEDMSRGANQMYDFLKWKLGSPSLVAAQWVTGGYEHFENSYRDEAAAMMLGVLDFSATEPELKIPVFLLSYIQHEIGKTDEAVAAFLMTQGVPKVLADALGDEVEKALQNLVERNKVGVYIPKEFDVENHLVETAILARREVNAGRIPGLSLPPRGPDKSGGRPHKDGNSTRSPSLPRSPQTEGPADGALGFAELEAQLAALEQRVQQLEQMLSRALELFASAERAVELEDAPVGYESLQVKVTTYWKGRLHLVVNGMQIGIFDTDKTMDVTPFLIPGKRNVVAFRFEPNQGAEPSQMRLSMLGTMAGSDQAMEFYTFVGSEDRMEDSVELPVAPAS